MPHGASIGLIHFTQIFNEEDAWALLFHLLLRNLAECCVLGSAFFLHCYLVVEFAQSAKPKADVGCYWKISNNLCLLND